MVGDDVVQLARDPSPLGDDRRLGPLGALLFGVGEALLDLGQVCRAHPPDRAEQPRRTTMAAANAVADAQDPDDAPAPTPMTRASTPSATQTQTRRLDQRPNAWAASMHPAASCAAYRPGSWTVAATSTMTTRATRVRNGCRRRHPSTTPAATASGRMTGPAGAASTVGCPGPEGVR